MDFKKPLSLSDSIEITQNATKEYNMQQYGLINDNKAIDLLKYSFAPEFKYMKFTKYLGSGRNVIVFENENGNAVKLCTRNHFAFRDTNRLEDFDAPVLKKGRVNNFSYYIQEKCSKEDIEKKHIFLMEKMMKDKGYMVFDLCESQLGFGKNGKLYLLDAECARAPQKIRESKDLDFYYWY